MNNSRLLFAEEVYALQGAIFAVHREMGCGFVEAVYQECLERELTWRKIPFLAHKELRLHYCGERLSQTFQVDMICFGEILLELKAVRSTLPAHDAQVINYLRASGLRLGLLVNFGAHPKVTVKRLIV